MALYAAVVANDIRGLRRALANATNATLALNAIQPDTWTPLDRRSL